MAFNRFATFLATLVLFALLLSSSSQLANATLTLEMVTIQNCSSNANTHVRSGVCSVDPLNPTQNGRLITCMDQVQQCAQLINFNDAQCSVFSGVFTAVCGQCQKLNANPPYWARPNCDPTTNLVTWDTNCGIGCTSCLNHGQFPHPFSQCSPALGGNGWSYNQGVQPCDAVNVTIVKSTTCAAGATMMDQFIVGQYSCNFGEYMSCTPKNPNITTQVGSAVVMTQCPFSSTSHTCSDCPQTYFPPGSCQPSPAGMSSVAIRANCDSTPAMCGDLVIHGNTQCSMFIGRSTPVCGSCMMLSATNGPQGTWSLIACNETSQAVTISHGCNADCSQCTMPNYVVHGYLQCSVGDPSGTSTFNRGLFPCNTVTYNHYSDAACTALVHVEVEAEGICQFDRQAQCVERLVTFQNCSNPSAAVTTRENVCVNDPVAPGKFREYGCMNQAPTCATLVAYKDALCQTFDHADIMVCGQCMLIPNRTTGAPEYLQIMCNATTQLVTLNTNCDSQCANCATKNAAVHPIGACSIAANPGFFIRNEGMHQCDAVHVSVYNTTGCNESGLEASFTVSQNMCSRDEFLQCTADPLPTPSYGNELVYTSCTDQHCGFGCTVMLDTTAGGCMPNFMGRPGAHVLSCDAVDSVCADLTIHQGFTCGSFVGSFHPVCNSCQPGFNATDPYGFIYVTCSQSNPNVTMSAGCDSKCQTCSQPNVFVHPYLQCSADSMKHDRSILNRGVIPCSTLSVIEYSDVTCRPSTQVASWHMARGFCEMGYMTSCNAATIGIQNCSACSSVAPNQAACNKSFITENSCIPDPYSAVLGGMRTVSCVPTWQQCVHLALFADAECTTYRTSAQAVCNQCNQLIETDGTIVYAMLTCNDAYNWVSIQTHCNSDCTMCNDTDSTLINNQCNPTNYIGGVFNFGATECDAVQISQYHTAGCTGQPVSTYMVGQHQCSFDEYYECSARPLNEEMQYIGKVVQRHCPNPTDFACTNCSISEAASGSCIFNPPKLGSHDFGSTRITCDGSHRQRTCAVLGVHTNAQCSDFAGVHQPVCGTCFRDSDLSYTQIVCDPSTQDVIFNKNCTQDCNSCTVQEVHAYMSCMAPLLPEPSNAGKYFFNRGLVPCETINIQHYNSINCNPSTLAVNYEISTDSCDNGFSVQCVPHVVHIQNCSSPTQLETVVAEGACTPDPFGLFRKYRCFDESLTCATLIQYEGTDDCEPQVTATGEARPNIIAGVCGSCLKRPTQWNPNSTTFEFFLLQCDPSTQDVWFDGGCNENCQSCTSPRQETHKFMQCSVPANMPAGRQASMFNQGVRPCSGVQISVYPDNSCTGSSINWFEAGQRDCGEQDHLYIYCDSNPNLNLPDGGQVLMSMCPWQHGEAAIKRVVEGDCTSGCMTYPVVDGACAPAPPGETRFASHRVSCDTQFVSKCADIVLFNTTGASNALTCTPSTFVGIHTPVCGSCYTFGMDTTFTHAICDEQAQQITFETGCNSDCTQCTNSNNNPVAMNECDMGQRPGWAFVSRGLFQCSTAVFMHYSSTDCDPGTSTGIMIVAQGVCEFNQRLQCAKNVITTQNCSCPTCAAAYTTENTCTEDDFGMFRQYSCAGVAQSCVNMGWFKDDQCQDYMSGYTVVCNTCWKSIDPFSGLPTYTGMMCNYSSQEVISLTQCSDGTCSDCIGMQFVHPFNNCSRFQRGSSLFNTGIVPCDSISVKLYNDSKCSTQSVDTWVQGQDFCALDEYISCMAAPIVNPSVKLNALNFYTCPQDQASALGYGCIGCTVSKEQSGQCYAADKPGHYRITNCDSEMAFCGAFVIHNDTTCKGGYLGDHNPVCGSCAQWFGQDTYTKVHCDIFSKNISLSFGCNAGCSQCTSNVTHGFMECSQLITKPEYTLYNRGVMPCSTVSITEYTAADCNAGSVVGTYQVPQDLCQVGHKVSCIWEPEVPTGGGSPESSGMSAGAAVGVTAVVLIAVFGGAFAIYKYRQRRVYRTVDPQWSAMNDTGAAPTPSNIQGSYGSLQDNAN